MSELTHQYYSGTSGLDLPVPRSQYPAEFREKSRLQYYASLFNSLEINSIFYKLPRPATLRKWVESVPDDFRFTCKLSKAVTHAKALQFNPQDVYDFVEVAENVGQKKGCILIQFPPSLKIDLLDRLQALLETVGEATQHTSWRLAVEFRNSGWYEREVYELLADYDATMVIQDLPKSATPFDVATTDIVYLRFHGPDPRYRGSYTNEVLMQYAQSICEWVARRKTVYAYFNNTVGAAVENLQTLNRLVREYRK